MRERERDKERGRERREGVCERGERKNERNQEYDRQKWAAQSLFKRLKTMCTISNPK
jgi:hypothetical protein